MEETTQLELYKNIEILQAEIKELAKTMAKIFELVQENREYIGKNAELCRKFAETLQKTVNIIKEE